MSAEDDVFAGGMALGFEAVAPLMLKQTIHQEKVRAVFNRYLALLKEAKSPQAAPALAKQAIDEVNVLIAELSK